MENMLVSDHYLGARGKHYCETQSPAESLGHRFQAEFFRPYVGPEDCVLDLGCGKGGLARHLPCRRIDGFDVNVETLKCASVWYHQTFSEYSGPAERAYDVVVSNHCLEHIPSPLAALRMVYKWLRPSGRAVFIVPHDCLSSHQSESDVADRDHHLYTWTPRTLGNLFQEAGFVVERSTALRSAYSPRLFRLHQLRWIGPWSRKCLCSVLHRAQVLCVGQKPGDR